MKGFWKKIGWLPDMQDVRLKPYPLRLSLDRLHTGVDNIRYDVCLSDSFQKSARDIILLFLSRYARTDETLDGETAASASSHEEEFKRICREIMTGAVNRAKLENEIQIDALAQAAIIKFILTEVNLAFNRLMDALYQKVRELEVTNRPDEAARHKKKLNEIQEHADEIRFRVKKEIFRSIGELQENHLNKLRQANSGDRLLVPDNFYANPMLCVKDASDEFFMIEKYHILLGRRIDDPDKHDVIIPYLHQLVLEMHNAAPPDPARPSPEKNWGLDADWLKRTENIDLLFNCFQSLHQCRLMNKAPENREVRDRYRRKARLQKKRLNYLFKKFNKIGLIRRIVATYEMQPIYRDYCPPLVPQLVLQFFISGRARRSVSGRLKRLKRFYGKNIPVSPLRRARRRLLFIRRSHKNGYLIRYLKDLARYHRDRENFEWVQEAIGKISLLTEEKVIRLSRSNQTLYEFVLSHEKQAEEQPITGHVIIKADIRGSTDFTYRMMSEGLNPASYFSLNFFDPITEVLSEYGAEKVFVEGDAIILSLFERRDSPDEWYAVARACGIAGRILTIVRQCNAANRENRLPTIELGLGISFFPEKPTFLFDGDHRIMISPAINRADRLSGCSKFLRKQMKNRRKPFNLYVFQTVSDEEMKATKDDILIRYNVNGVELNGKGFKKLNEEIELKTVEVGIKALSRNKVRFYTGIFPTKSGKYERLILRASRVPRIDPETFSVMSLTRRSYFEICTNPKLHEYIANQVN